MEEGWGGLDPAQGVPHGHGLPQSGQHLVPVCDPHAAGLWADDHVTQVLAPAVVRGFRHRHPQGEFLQNSVTPLHSLLCGHDSASPSQF